MNDFDLTEFDAALLEDLYKNLPCQVMLDIWQNELGNPKNAKVTKFVNQFSDLDGEMLELAKQVYELKTQLSKMSRQKRVLCRELVKKLSDKYGSTHEVEKQMHRFIKKSHKKLDKSRAKDYGNFFRYFNF